MKFAGCVQRAEQHQSAQMKQRHLALLHPVMTAGSATGHACHAITGRTQARNRPPLRACDRFARRTSEWRNRRSTEADGSGVSLISRQTATAGSELVCFRFRRSTTSAQAGIPSALGAALSLGGGSLIQPLERKFPVHLASILELENLAKTPSFTAASLVEHPSI